MGEGLSSSNKDNSVTFLVKKKYNEDFQSVYFFKKIREKI